MNNETKHTTYLPIENAKIDIGRKYATVVIDDADDMYSTQLILGMSDHVIKQYNPLHVAYTIRRKEYNCSNLRRIVKRIESRAIEHPGSHSKVFDIVHPSHYPFVDGKSIGNNGKVFDDQYGAHTHERRKDYYIEMSEYNIEMTKTKLRWLPTVYQQSTIKKEVKTKSGKTKIIEKQRVEQLSYINDLFDLPEEDVHELEDELAKMVSHATYLFEALDNDMHTESSKECAFDNLQIIIKIAQYDLKPRESHEGIWHVEGVPDEHIIMTCTCYFEDDFGDCKLEFRRDRSEEEQMMLMNIPEQGGEVLDSASTTYQELGFLETEIGHMYAWTNACQHRLLKITNNSDETKRRSFVAFFLVDPSIKVVSTADILPQNTTFSKKKSMKLMVDLMKNRQSIKDGLNSSVAKTISYCEH
jgi:hypothetical protein